MYKKRWLILISFVLVAGMVLAACSTATEAPPAVDEEAQARIAELEAALADAKASGGASDEQLAELQAELEDLNANLGELESEFSEVVSDQCSFNAYRMGWIMDWADAGNIVDTVFGAKSDFHYTFWHLNYPDAADEYVSLTQSAFNDTNLETRSATWGRAEEIIVEDLAAVIPIYHYDRTNVISTDLNTVYAPFGAPKVALWNFDSGATTLRTAVGAAVPTLDINEASDTTSSFVIGQMIDGPFRFDEAGGLVPNAAESFEVSDDGLVWTVHLRQDGVWSDGEPVIAQDFVDGIKRLLSPDLANDYAWVMFDIVGAADYNAGDLDELESVYAVDDYTFEFTLNEPRSYFDSLLAFSTFQPVRLDVIALHGDAWTLPGNFVSNGAYVLVERNPGENIVLEKNPNYWNADAVEIERIEINVILEQATSLAAFENGELDMTNAMSGGFPPEDTSRLAETDAFVRMPRPGTYYVGLNTSAIHTQNVAFRKALAASIDKRAILDNVIEMPWRIEAYGLTPPEILAYQGAAVGYSFDETAALGYLEEYMNAEGIEDAGSIVVELWYNKSGANQEILEAVEAMWEGTLGIDVRTVNVEWATYLDTLEECNVLGGGGF
jgi:oligopeptide transport system substrate-binding protein